MSSVRPTKTKTTRVACSAEMVALQEKHTRSSPPPQQARNNSVREFAEKGTSAVCKHYSFVEMHGEQPPSQQQAHNSFAKKLWKKALSIKRTHQTGHLPDGPDIAAKPWLSVRFSKPIRRSWEKDILQCITLPMVSIEFQTPDFCCLQRHGSLTVTCRRCTPF